MCGTFQGAIATGALAGWAQCWFLFLVIVAMIAVATLFLLVMLEMANLHRKI